MAADVLRCRDWRGMNRDVQESKIILNERILQVVLVLAEELHFGRGAARLHVSQPALSGTLKSLERDLGVGLFTRTSRHVEMTEAGRVLAVEARHLIEEGERAVTLVRRCSPDVLGPIYMGYPPSVDPRWLCALISHARTDTRLGINLQCVSTEAGSLPYALIKRTLHASIIAGRLSHQDLQCVTFVQEPFAVVVGSKHALAGSASLGFDQFKEEPVVWLRRNSDPLLYDSFMVSCSAQGYRPKVVQETGTFHECLEFSRAGLGITFLPSYMQSHGGDKSVVFARLPNGALQAEYGLAYRRNADSQDLARFVKFVQDHARKKSAL
jgi:DNA-binding transcriptional LysR family regulator